MYHARFNLHMIYGFSTSESLISICSLSPADEISHDYDEDEDEQHYTYTNGHSVVWLVGFAQVNYSNRQRDAWLLKSKSTKQNTLSKNSEKKLLNWYNLFILVRKGQKVLFK